MAIIPQGARDLADEGEWIQPVPESQNNPAMIPIPRALRARLLGDLTDRAAEVRQKLAALDPASPLYADTMAALRFAAGSVSPATCRAYASDLAHFHFWCDQNNQVFFPAEPETVAVYLAHLARTGHKASTVARHKSAISTYHRLRGVDTPATASNPAIAQTMRGIQRASGTAPEGKEPMSIKLLARLIESAEGTMAAARDRAILLTGFAGGLRRSELADLRLEDLRWHNQGVTIKVRRSKTDQAGQGREVELVYGLQPDGTPLGELLCPVRALRQWIEQANLKEGYLFRPVSQWQTLGERLDGDSVGSIIRRALKRAGLDPRTARKYGAHSSRSGFATTAYANGASDRLIMEQTGHQSLAMVHRYIKPDRKARIEAAKKLGL